MNKCKWTRPRRSATTMPAHACRQFMVLALITILSNVSFSTSGAAQGQLDPRRRPPGYVPVAERQMERGCNIALSHELGVSPATTLF